MTRPLCLVTLLTVTAFLLRLPGVGQSLFADELFTFADVDHPGLSGVLEDLRDFRQGSEQSPPLFFVIAWAAAKVGDPTVWIRVPSLVFGTATVPLVYLLGTRTVGRAAGFVAAALVTFSPFAIFYSSEARPYEMLVFLATLSTLALLLAVESPRALRARWWVVYALVSCAVVYTHYTGVFVLGAQAVWALVVHRAQWRELLLANLAAALAFLPWIPYVGNAGLNIYKVIQVPLTATQFGNAVGKVSLGHPFAAFREIPGRAELVTLGLVLAIAAVLGAGRYSARLRSGKPWTPSSNLVLVVALALATPVGVFLYSKLSGHNIFLARYLNASLPGIALLVAALLTSLRPMAAVIAVTAAVGAMAVGSIQLLGSDYRRPPFDDAAKLVDARAGENDAVVDFSQRILPLYLKERHALFQADAERRALAHAARGGWLIRVLPRFGPVQRPQRYLDPQHDIELHKHHLLPGFFPVAVDIYAATPRRRR